MKIAILSDIHGNSVALKSVLKEVDKNNIKKIFVLGDMVGYYYYPEEVFEMLKEYNVHYIRGNHEQMLLQAISDSDYLLYINRKYGFGIKYAIEKLGDEYIELIKRLPEKIETKIKDVNVVFCHGAIGSVEKYIYPDEKIETLEEISKEKFDYLFFGHTHYPFVFAKNGKVLVNAGSVGQARDVGGMASWCIFNLENRTVIFKHTIYDASIMLEQVKKINPDIPFLQEVLTR